MTSAQQRAALQRQIWQIANDVRGAVDGWDFKQYVLGTLFYRFISENFASYIEGGDDSIHYAELPDNVITADIKDDAIKTKGYFIYPSQLFANVAPRRQHQRKPEHRPGHASLRPSKAPPTATRPSRTSRACLPTSTPPATASATPSRTRTAAWPPCSKVWRSWISATFDDSQIDLFGDAYEFLISNYAANAGKSGGEFFTPQHVSKLIAQLAMHKQTSVNKIYDPACGSGSLLLQAKKHFDAAHHRRRFLRAGDQPHHLQPGADEHVPAQHQLRQVQHPAGRHADRARISATTNPSMPSSPTRRIR